jgi:hypothetical protein
MPNAGLPGRVGGEFVWAASAGYFADAVPRFLATGARIVGGCCGTSPEHVAAMRQALDREVARGVGSSTVGASAAGPSALGPSPHAPRTQQGAVLSTTTAAASGDPGATMAAPPPTGLAVALDEGRFVVSVESTHRDRCASNARCSQPS